MKSVYSKRVATGIALGAALVAGSAYAQDESMYWAGRIGPMLGMYQGEAKITLTDLTTGAADNLSIDGDWEPAYGLQTGISAGYGNFFADLGLEYQRIDFGGDSLDRTDILLSAGYLLNDLWSVFAGYRQGMQGDGVFNDDTLSERGFFIGAGVGGMQMGQLVVGASLAYNLSEVEDFPVEGADFDYPGISLKVSASLKDHPQHGFQLRYQRFSGDDKLLFQDGQGQDIGRLDYELTESYVQLSYLYNFAF